MTQLSNCCKALFTAKIHCSACNARCDGVTDDTELEELSRVKREYEKVKTRIENMIKGLYVMMEDEFASTLSAINNTNRKEKIKMLEELLK